MTRPAIDGETTIYGLLGHPVKSSLSPAMHNAAFAALEINSVYLALPLLPERFGEGIRGLLALGVAGFNLTVPHKTAILPFLHELTPQARRIGAVNTVRNEHGRLLGTNTDGAGFLMSVGRELDWRPAGKHVLLLGAGGAARGIAHGLLEQGAARLDIANRTEARAQALAAELREHHPRAEIRALPLPFAGGVAVHLLVNTTSVGMGDGASPLDIGSAHIADGVVDIVYTPLETPLLAQARARRLPHINGIGMLLYQGWQAFHFWTGREAPEAVMREALLAGLAARRR